MENKMNSKVLLKERETMYRFLKRLYILEVDENLFKSLSDSQLPKSCTEPVLEEGCRMMEQCISDYSSDDIEKLAVDYADTFLAAGVAEGHAAFPYESVYTSKKQLTGQKARKLAASAYANHNLMNEYATYKVPDDHIAVEFEFMSHLCRLAQGESEERCEELLKEQKVFFTEHICNWVPAFCSDVETYAETSFYRSLAKITAGFIKTETLLLSYIVNESGG